MQFIKCHRKVQKPTILVLTVLLVAALLATIDVLADSDSGVKTALRQTEDDFTSPKGSLTCHACVEISEIFLNDTLSSIRERYTRYIGNPPSSAASMGKNTGGAHSVAQARGARQRMMVELHEGIDGLCDQLGEKHLKLRSAADESIQAGLSGSIEGVRRGIRSLCEATLEELSDAFLTAALKLLLPTASPGGSEPQAYELPTARAFCEAQRLCQSHHDIKRERDMKVNPPGGSAKRNPSLVADILSRSAALWRRLGDLWNVQQVLDDNL